MIDMALVLVEWTGPRGVVLLVAASAAAAMLGIGGLAWAMILVWRENNPPGVMARGRSIDGQEKKARRVPTVGAEKNFAPRRTANYREPQTSQYHRLSPRR